VHILTHAEATERAGLIEVRGYDVELDLTTGPETFASSSTIRFVARPGSSTFVEIDAPRVRSARLNGRDLDLATALDGDRIALGSLAADNELTVVADCAYSHSGEGLHRFVDPADDEAYTYTQLFLYEAHRVFACFDQPDLKAPWTLRVTAPTAWTVLSNAAGRPVAPGRWAFDATPPMATYFAALAAGPYHSVTAVHDGIALGLHCRRSLAPFLEADELFDITRRSFDFYHALFGVRYPWGPYDQVFVPEFNAGAMENPGCVTFRDELVFRSRVTDDRRERRALIVAHELSHMWFGDLVTMRWWDDLWLNESFAEYISHRALSEATRFVDAWASFACDTKAWGYRQDQLPTTHPVAGEAPDSDAALLNFDGISYAKGAAVLRQLDAWVGHDASARAYAAYFRANAFGNATIDDYLEAMGEAGGRDLRPWADEWLRAAGINALTPEVVVGADGSYASVAIAQSAADEQPTLRSHRIALGMYDRVDDRLVRRERLELDVTGPRTEVPQLVGAPAADLLVVNDDDLTWAKIRFDERSFESVRRGDVGRIESALTRAVVWNGLWEMTRDGILPAGELVRLVLDGLGRERHLAAVTDLLRIARESIDVLGDPDRRDLRLAELSDRCRALLDASEPGSSLQLAYARAYAAAAAGDAAVARLRGWLAGADVPDGLAIDDEFRWAVVERLAAIGAMGDAEVDAVLAEDRTSAGELHAATARASQPTAAAKRDAWHRLVDDDSLSNHMVEATVTGFVRPAQEELLRPYADGYFDEIRALFAARPMAIGLSLAYGLFPHALVEAETVTRADALLEQTELAPPLRRILVERRADLVLALRAREVDRGAG